MKIPSLNSRGQGTVEYILIVVVVITMALAIGARLFVPMNKWINHYMGEYIKCLLDQSELPTLGGSEAASECNEKFEPFTISGGRPEKAKAAANNNQSNSRNNSPSSSNGGNYQVRNGRSRSALGSGFDGGNKNGKVTQVRVGDLSLSNRSSSSYSVATGGRVTRSSQPSEYKGFSGLVEREKERIKRRNERVTSISRSEAGLGEGGSKKRIISVETRREKSKDINIDISDWSFGNMLRTLLIIVIVIALALFLAGQLAQISKSMEKT